MKYSLIAGMIAATATLSAQTLVSTDITTNTTWSGTIVLDGPIYVKNDATLKILAGTIVRGQPRQSAGDAGAPGSLIVTQNGRVEATGTAAAPVIFTTAAVDNGGDGLPDSFVSGPDTFLTAWSSPTDTFYDLDPLNNPLPPVNPVGEIPGSSGPTADARLANVQLWGGLIILGNAPTNLGTTDSNSAAQKGYIEGLTNNADTEFGGIFVNDDSGILRYVSVRHGGDELGSGNEINGITLGGVGSGTVMEFCEVYCTYDDGFEWFGGTMNTRNLVATFAGDDAFDGDQGWTGVNQFWFGVMPYFETSGESGDEGFEFDGDDSSKQINDDGLLNPYPNYLVYNATIVGPTGATGYDSDIGGSGRLEFKSNFSGGVFNTIVVNTGASLAGINNNTGNSVSLAFCTFDDVDGATTTSELAEGNVTSTSILVNPVTPPWAGLRGEDASVNGGLNPRPFPGPAASSTLVTPAGVQQTTYRGAFPTATTTDLWTKGWTVLSKQGVLVD